MNKKSQIMSLNLNYLEIVLEALDEIISSPNNIDSFVEENDVTLNFLANNIVLDTFMHSDGTVQEFITEVSGFINEALNCFKFVESGRTVVSGRLLSRPASITINRIAEMFTIGLVKHVQFCQVYLPIFAQRYPESYAEIDRDLLDSIYTTLDELPEEITELIEKYNQYNLENYFNIEIESDDDEDWDVKENDGECNNTEDKYAYNVAKFDLFEVE